MKPSIYTDLAMESPAATGRRKTSEYEEKERDGFLVQRLTVDSEELVKKYGRRRGTYITVGQRKLWLLDEDEEDALCHLLAEELRTLARRICQRKMGRDLRVLVAGLGNVELVADALGPMTVGGLTVTRHLHKEQPLLFRALGQCSVSAVRTGVLSQTGIESGEMLLGVCRCTEPDLVVAVDALASRSYERLGATVQISDAGISPGAGIGNLRREITKESLGVPVIALGVPTVVDSATLVYDALERAGIEDPDGKLEGFLDGERGFFVCPKECDIICRRVSSLLARALDELFCVL